MAQTLTKERTRERVVRGCYRNMTIVTLLAPFTVERYDQFLDHRTAHSGELLKGRIASTADIEGHIEYTSYEYTGD